MISAEQIDQYNLDKDKCNLQSQDDFFLTSSKGMIKLKPPDFEIRKRVQANPRLIYQATPKVSAHFWAIFDVNKQSFIHGKREYMRREVASLTKMMTAYTILDLAR